MSITIHGLTSKVYFDTQDLIRVDDQYGYAYSIPLSAVNKSEFKNFDPGEFLIEGTNVQDVIVEIMNAPEVGPNAYFQQSNPQEVTLGPGGDFEDISSAIIAGERLVSLDPSSPRPTGLYTIKFLDDYDPQGEVLNLGGGFDLSHITLEPKNSGIHSLDLNVVIGDGTQGPTFCIGLSSLTVDGYEATASIYRSFIHNTNPIVFGDLLATNSGVIYIKPTESINQIPVEGFFGTTANREIEPLEVVIEVNTCYATKLGKVIQQQNDLIRSYARRGSFGRVSAGMPLDNQSSPFKAKYNGTLEFISVVGNVDVSMSSSFKTLAGGSEGFINCSFSSTANYGTNGGYPNKIYGGLITKSSTVFIPNSDYVGSSILEVSGASELTLDNKGYTLLDTPPLLVKGASKAQVSNKKWLTAGDNLVVNTAGRIYLDNECEGFTPSITLNTFSPEGIIQGPVGSV